MQLKLQKHNRTTACFCLQCSQTKQLSNNLITDPYNSRAQQRWWPHWDANGHLMLSIYLSGSLIPLKIKKMSAYEKFHTYLVGWTVSNIQIVLFTATTTYQLHNNGGWKIKIHFYLTCFVLIFMEKHFKPRTRMGVNSSNNGAHFMGSELHTHVYTFILLLILKKRVWFDENLNIYCLTSWWGLFQCCK